MTDSRRSSAAFEPTQVDKRTAFFTARRNGISITQASKIAGIHRDTGTRWEAEARTKAAQLSSQGGLVATKTQLAEIHTQLAMSADVDARDRIAASKALADLLGMNEPSKTHNVNVQVSVAPSMIELLRSRRAARIAERERQALASGEQRVIGDGGGSPTQVAAESITAPQNITKKSEKE